MLTIRIYICLLCSLCSIPAFCQMLEEFNFHMRSIDSSFHSIYLQPGEKSTADYQREFIKFTIDNLLSEPSDSVFISNRRFLPRLMHICCDRVQTSIADTMSNGDIIHVELKLAIYDSTKHKLKWYGEEEDVCCIESIDGQIPYGAMYLPPAMEICSLKIIFNGKSLWVPSHAYQNLYDPNVCNDDGYYEKRIEVYTSRNNEYIYLYVYGGQAADSYFAKLIFDHKGYVTRIVADYWSLQNFDCFRKWAMLY